MADVRRYELDDLVTRPGLYFNPDTEMLLTVDDGASIDTEVIDEASGGDWIRVSDELPVDETRRDELVESFAAGLADGGLDAGDDLGEPDPNLEDEGFSPATED
jgi:hypothetical protein